MASGVFFSGFPIYCKDVVHHISNGPAVCLLLKPPRDSVWDKGFILELMMVMKWTVRCGVWEWLTVYTRLATFNLAPYNMGVASMGVASMGVAFMGVAFMGVASA